MNMDPLEEIMMAPNDLTHIVKGKRTKRQRLQSPIPFTITTHSNGSTNGNGNGNYVNQNSSPASSAEFCGSTTEEEEDTAKCLILLSQGTNKFTSKRYLESPTTANGGKAAGIYVYECKTCNRSFSSFQALGGHRASHKKPKLAAAEENKKKPFIIVSEDEEVSLKNNNNNIFFKSVKVHECSICGAEFTSGQALGGHMRRHRAPIAGANTTLSLCPISPIAMDSEDGKKPRNGLCLDLNLPAPEESNFGLVSKQEQQKQQPALVLSAAPALVDCHY